MKYLIRFNESVDDGNVENYCKNCLAYILDNGFDINLSYNIHSITLCFYRKDSRRTSPALVHTSKTFSWNEIKDDFIPFLESYNDKYTSGKYSIKGINFYMNEPADPIKRDGWINFYCEKNVGKNGERFEDILNDTMSYELSEIDNIQIILYKYNTTDVIWQ